MEKTQFSLGKKNHLIIATCAGDITLRGWPESDVRIKGDFQAEETEGGLQVTGAGDLIITVPQTTSLAVGRIDGDAAFRNIQGDLSLAEVGGDLNLSNTGFAKIQQVHGDLSARNLDGNLHVSAVFGDMSVRNLAGDLSAEQVQGDCHARNVQGNITLGQVLGDANFHSAGGDLSVSEVLRDVNLTSIAGKVNLPHVTGDIRLKNGLGGSKNLLKAGGDIVFTWPVTSGLSLEARAAEVVNRRLRLEDVVEKDGMFYARIGDGSTAVSLDAGGRIILKSMASEKNSWDMPPGDEFKMDFMFDLQNLGEQISAQINQQMARVSSEFDRAFGPEFAQKMAQQAERAAAKAEKAARRAQKHYAAQAAPRSETKATSSRASVEEQLKILKMVENGTISPKEAAALLEALEA